MINIFSIKCSLAFAPYLLESVSAFSDEGAAPSRVVRQGGSGLIVRSDERMMLRYRNQETALDEDDISHYRTTIDFRATVYDVLRMSDEVVMASVERNLLLSHPQSELWLDRETLPFLIASFREGAVTEDETRALPDWLDISEGGDRLLLSDRRNGRWVLLAREHIDEFERRLPLLEKASAAARTPALPTFSIKGVAVHLQSAARLARSLAHFAETQEVEPFEETAPAWRLTVGRSTEGFEISDRHNRAGITVREARKWAAILSNELARSNASEILRGHIKTVFADGDKDFFLGGRWVLQWGDEVFVPDELISRIASQSDETLPHGRATEDWPEIKRVGRYFLLLSGPSGACVALTADEMDYLIHAV
ncbi:MAG: hypothetical protein L0229_31520 [Blastocatellia bacterium]|nr:hypothetical protein [Blastocatellia bacterium]